MAKRIIRTGTTADPTGDSLKNAFTKVNDNFTELYNALGLDADTLNLGAFEFNGSVMTTTDSTAITIDQAVTVSSNLTVGGDLLPQTANGGSIGSSSLPWKSLYVSTNTIYINNVPLSLDPSNKILVNNTPISQTITYADIPGVPTVPTDISDLDDIDGLLTSGGNTSVDTTETRTDTENWESAYYQGGEGSYYITFTNIDPSMRRWYQLYMDNSKSTGRSITLNGSISVTYNSWDYGGNGTFYLYLDEEPIPNPTTITSVAAQCVMENKVAISETGGISIYSGHGDAVNIQSGFQGDVTVRAGDDISLFAGNKVNSANDGGTIQISAGDGGSADNDDSAGGGGDIQIYAGDGGSSSDFHNASSGGSITIQSGQGGGANEANSRSAGQGAHLFIRAGDAGSNDGDVALGQIGGNVEIYAGSSSSVDAGGSIILQAAGGNTVGGGVNISAGEGGTSNGSVEINTTGGDYTWTFDPTGVTRFPNNTLKTRPDTRFNIDANDIGEDYAWVNIRNLDVDSGSVNSQVTVRTDGVGISTTGGSVAWSFSNTGDLTLPAGGDIVDSNGDSVLGGGTGNIEFDGTWIKNVSTGNIFISPQDGNTFLDLPSDSQASTSSVRLGNVDATGIVRIQAGDAGKYWEFKHNGTTRFPSNTIKTAGSLVVQSLTGVPSGITQLVSQVPGWDWNGGSNLATTGGSGTGLTVNVGDVGSGYTNLGAIAIHTAGTGYVDGDVITVTSGPLNPGSFNGESSAVFVISVPSSTWTFAADGAITANNAFTIKTPSSTLIPSDYSGGGGWNQGYTDLATTGGTGTGLTVDVADEGSGYININSITINNPGSGYLAGDVITITNNLTLSGTFTLAAVPNTWNFGTNGRTKIPHGSNGPSTARGDTGDKAGMILVSGAYLFYCYADYTDGNSPIWQKVSMDNTDWD